jgi:hypothetical protein
MRSRLKQSTIHCPKDAGTTVNSHACLRVNSISRTAGALLRVRQGGNEPKCHQINALMFWQVRGRIRARTRGAARRRLAAEAAAGAAGAAQVLRLVCRVRVARRPAATL